MRLLVITNQFPLPLDTGGPVRILGLMRALAASHELHVLARRRSGTSDELVDELACMLGARVEAFPHRSVRRNRLAVEWRWVRALWRGMPPWVLEQHDPALARRARSLAPACAAVVLLDDYAGAYARRLSGLAPIVADKHRVAGWSVAPLTPSAAAGPSALRDRIGRWLSLGLTRRFERRSAQAVEAVVVTSEEERARFRTLYDRLPEAVVPTAVTLTTTRRAGPRTRRVGWLGTHDYEANVDGLVRFVEEGWDALGDNGFELLVAGGNPTPRVCALERHPGVRVLGYVEHLADFLDQIEAAVVPLWQGAGVKVKTLTLMGAGIPVVGTPVALEGLDAEHGSHCLIGSEPHELATGLQAIAADEELAERLAAAGRRLVTERFTWDSVGPRFAEVVELAVAHRTLPSSGRKKKSLPSP